MKRTEFIALLLSPLAIQFKEEKIIPNPDKFYKFKKSNGEFTTFESFKVSGVNDYIELPNAPYDKSPWWDDKRSSTVKLPTGS